MTVRVGVRELKARLSHCLKMASQGEAVTVTDRGRPVAVIRPISREAPQDPAIEAAWRLVRAGKARWRGGKLKGLTPGIVLSGGPSIAQTIIEGRE